MGSEAGAPRSEKRRLIYSALVGLNPFRGQPAKLISYFLSSPVTFSKT